MRRSNKQLPVPSFEKGIIVIVGSYGSGKSEVAVNLSRHLVATQADPVAIADLDIVNPYFRSREAAHQLQTLGIRTINPTGGQAYADIPIVLPEIRGAIEQNRGKLVLDVGGDDVGARILSSLADAFVENGYELLLVLNANRPFTSDVDGCLKMMHEIESASRLRFTGIVANSHLMESTTPEVVRSGLALARLVSERSGLPVVFLSATTDIIDDPGLGDMGVPILPLQRLLLKPWERGTAGGD
jgi:hypothetical protein